MPSRLQWEVDPQVSHAHNGNPLVHQLLFIHLSKAEIADLYEDQPPAQCTDWFYPLVICPFCEATDYNSK